MELERASSINDCPDIEHVWASQQGSNNITANFEDLILSHSDAEPLIHIDCPDDYHVVGPTTIMCLKGGTWSDVTVPTCSSSSLYGIPESDLILIGVLGASGAIIVITLTIIIAHLLCFRHKNTSDTSSLVQRLDRLSECYPGSGSYFIDDTNIYSLPLPPPCATSLNDQPISASFISNRAASLQNGGFYDNTSLCNFSLPRYYIHSAGDRNFVGRVLENGSPSSQRRSGNNVTSQDDVMMFLNHGYSEEHPRSYVHNWENDLANNIRLSHERVDYNTIDRTIF